MCKFSSLSKYFQMPFPLHFFSNTRYKYRKCCIHFSKSPNRVKLKNKFRLAKLHHWYIFETYLLKYSSILRDTIK
ncbi:hypothetical protein EMGBS15_17110 [Filimonas sp.]|nr:hypothetical protein EMGBS15_17110 [Filimonas sp.]